MTTEQLIEEFDGRFESRNEVEVDRVWMTREKWEEIRKHLQDSIKWNRYQDARFDIGEGEVLTTHILIGVNSWADGNWTGFHNVTVDEFEEVMEELKKEE